MASHPPRQPQRMAKTRMYTGTVGICQMRSDASAIRTKVSIAVFRGVTDGMNSLVDLSRLKSVVVGYTMGLYLNAYHGGAVDLRRLTNANGRVLVDAEDSGSVVDLTGLPGRWKSSGNSAIGLEARTGAAILMPNVTELEFASLTVVNTGRISTAQPRPSRFR